MAFQAQPARQPIPPPASSLPPASSQPQASWGHPKSKKAHKVIAQQDKPAEAAARVTVNQAGAIEALQVTFYLPVYTEYCSNL